MRARAFVLWKAAGPFLGIFTTAPQTIDDIEGTWGVIGAWNRHRTEPVGLLSDARAFRAAGPPGPLMSHMLGGWGPVAESLDGAFSRCAVILPHDWSRAWWVGAAQLGMPGPASGPVMPTDDLDAAWRWLGAPAGLAESVAALTESATTHDRVRVSAEAHLRRDPTLALEAVACHLGTSPRSLQRDLTRAGESFAVLRGRIRFETAAAQIVHSDEKIDTIGSAVGFRSRSHFVAWFRQQTGATPAAFRERARVAAPATSGG